MGRNSSGVRGAQSASSTPEALAYKGMQAIEELIRNDSKETLFIFSSKTGKEVYSKTGTETEVTFNRFDAIEGFDGYMTHNHPIPKNYRYSFGASISSDDLRTAFMMNLKAVRAVTPNYTYELRATKKWRDIFGDAYEMQWQLMRAQAVVDGSDMHYRQKYKRFKTKQARATETYWHRVMKEFVKEHDGIEYTKIKVK